MSKGGSKISTSKPRSLFREMPGNRPDQSDDAIAAIAMKKLGR